MSRAAKSVLITAYIDDIHAATVAEALEELGHTAILFNTSNIPERTRLSVHAGGMRSGCDVEIGPNMSLSGVDVSWFRRIGPPVVPESVGEADRLVAVRECNAFIAGIMALVSDGAFAVNHYHSAIVAESKIYQLKIAQRVGFRVPRTLFANDPTSIRHFLSHENASIYKPFVPAAWDVDGRIIASLTVPLTAADLPSDNVLALSPGIFQERISKKYELRVMCMGNTIVAVRLNSQGNKKSVEDWRGVPSSMLSPEIIDLPDDIVDKCRLFMRALNLMFGCIDLIVDEQDDIVFLEINQMGQFLWLESANPEIRMLDKFVNFLLSSDPLYDNKSGSFGLSYSEFEPRGKRRIEREKQFHNSDYRERLPLKDATNSQPCS